MMNESPTGDGRIVGTPKDAEEEEDRRDSLEPEPHITMTDELANERTRWNTSAHTIRRMIDCDE